MDDAAEGGGGDSTGCNTCTNGYIASEAFSNRRQLTYLYPRVRCILNPIQHFRVQKIVLVLVNKFIKILSDKKKNVSRAFATRIPCCMCLKRRRVRGVFRAGYEWVVSCPQMQAKPLGPLLFFFLAWKTLVENVALYKLPETEHNLNLGTNS